MRKWAMRILGILNLLGIAGSFWYLGGMLQMHWHRWPESANSVDWAIFWLLLAFNLYLSGHLAYCSIRMIRKDETAILPAFLLQAAQILFMIADVVVFWLILPHSMSKITFGLWSVALSGIDMQVYSGIAPIGLVALLILMLSRYRSQLRVGSANMPQPGGIQP